MGGGCNDVCRNIDPSMGTFASQECIPHQSEWTQWTQWTVHSVYVPSLITYLRLIWVPYQNALAQNIKSASLGTPIDLLARGMCGLCFWSMSQDIFPRRIRVPVFVMTRLCANAEIGVPRGRIAFPRHPCIPVIPAFPRHPCLSTSFLPSQE